jgi:signal transduction histidine kinase
MAYAGDMGAHRLVPAGIARRGPSHPALLLLIAAVLLLDGHLSPEANGLSVEGVLAVALIVTPLLWVREAPVLVFAVVTVGLAACLATLKPHHVVGLPEFVVVYTLARYGDRRRSLWVVAASFAIILVAVGLGSEDGPLGPDGIANMALAALSVVLGDAVRSRVELRHAEAERAERLVAEEVEQGRRRLVEERLRIAREVHDVVAHSMVAINVQSGVAEFLLQEEDPDAVAPALREIKRVSGEALSDLRATLGLIRGDEADAPVAPAAGLERLDALAAPLRAAGVEVMLSVDTPPEDVPTAVAAVARRIVQEALTNVLRHAGARRAEVRVSRTRDALVVDVVDDGAALVPAGADRPPPGSGSGVRGMRERAEAVGGTLVAGADADGAGWRVHAVLPLA